MIDFQHRAPGIQEADELNHRIERNPREFLPVTFAALAREQLRAGRVDEEFPADDPPFEDHKDYTAPPSFTGVSVRSITVCADSSTS